MEHVLIADDHEVTRRGIREILRDEFPSVEVHEAASNAAALAMLPTQPWDLVLLDILMPGGNVLDTIAGMRSLRPEVPILIVTAVNETEYVVQTLKAGASGVIHKHRASDDLLVAIRKVLHGDTYLHPETASAVARALRDSERPLLHQRLSERELEILKLIALGRAIKEIAADLDLSDKTVATYVARIREKTGLTSHVEIARYALRNGLVE